MSVFDANTDTRTEPASDLGADDYGLRDLGGLTLSGITSVGCLAPTTGADVKLVHGEYWQELQGDSTENLRSKLTTTILLDESRTVMGNQIILVVGNVTATVHGSTTTLNSGPVDRSYVSSIIEDYSSAHQQNEDSGLYEVKFFNGEVNVLHQSNDGAKFEIVMYGGALQAYKCEVVEMETQVKELKNGLHAIESEAHGFRNFINGVRNEISGAAAKERGVEAKAGPDVQGPPSSLGAN